MPTKLSRFCDGVMEAAWLAALILVPLFFDIYSSRIFEPDKITLLRSLALIILAAWIVKLIDGGWMRWEKLQPGNQPVVKYLLRFPLIAPVVALALVYILATLFSVTPRVSLWGSYQRLQGVYSTLSYLLIFAAMVANLRRRVQVERLITTAVLVSLPIGLYGILQRYNLDPVPWGGDVSIRIAANMGNSIFVAAYLIMVFPLAVGRILQSFRAILKDDGNLFIQVARATVYVFIAAVQVLALYMSGSRGPALGWIAGTFVLMLLLSLYWRKRILTYGIVGAALAVGAFLFVFNLPDGPLEGLRTSPAIGRFGQLLDADSNSALVRQYIWEGAAKLVMPHPPLEFPDGSRDTYNFLRPLIGYGPESMYVAFNPFYPPPLGQVERRNASPDRSHNETWDSLVITGGIGLIVYLSVFVSVFYYGLKWIGLVNTPRQRNLFLALCLGGGAVGAAGLMAWRGIEYFGIGLPFGIALGLIAYITQAAVFGGYEPPKTSGEAARSLTLMVLLAAILSHFLEINFGIAIASTRTYFWVYSALLLLVGYVLPLHGEYQTGLAGQSTASSNTVVEATSQKVETGRKSKRRKSERGSQWQVGSQQAWMLPALSSGLLVAIVLGTLGFNYVTNISRLTSSPSIIWASLTMLANHGNAVSFGVLALVFVTWFGMAIVLASEFDAPENLNTWVRNLSVILGFSAVLGLLFWLWHAGNLVRLATFAPTNQEEILQQVSLIGGLLSNYYLYALLLVFGLAYLIHREQPAKAGSLSLLGPAVAVVLVFTTSWLIYSTNLRVIHADIAYKTADPFTRSDRWPVATLLYKQALSLAPDEDFYYLFLGRSYLEQAKSVEDEASQENLVRETERDLKQARIINPLNTDHTANLARLYNWWASRATDPQIRQQRGEVSSQYYERAVVLSPNNSTLWGEWAILFMEILDQQDEAFSRLSHALELDSKYVFTHGLMGDYYARLARSTPDDPEARQAAYAKAIEHYETGLAVARYFEAQNKITNLLNLGGVYAEVQQFEQAIDAYERAIELAPQASNVWRIEASIAQLYVQLGDKGSALLHANQASAVAPEAQQSQIQTLIAQIQALP